MAEQSNRPPIRIRLRFNVDTGAVEFIVDDNSPARTEDYHNRVAQAIAGFLARHPEIQDAGHIRYRLDREWYELTQTYEQKQNEQKKETLAR